MMYLLGPLRGGIHTIAASVAIAVLACACACACARSAGAEIVAPYTDADLVSDVTVQTEGFLDIQADAVEHDPRDSDYGCSPRMKDCESLPTYWKAEVVTPVPQGVNGSLVQAVLFSNEHRNPDNPQRVLSFAGAMLWGTGVRDDQTAIPDGACLAAMYQFKDTTFAEATWQHLCFQNGYTVPDVAAWAEQIEALVEKTKPTFLTGHKLGCDIALTVGLLNPTLPVPLPGTGVANVCVYDHPNPGLRCDPGNNNMPFDTAPWSDCSMRTSSVMGLGMGTQNIDFERDCMPKQDIGIDFRLRDCPYEGYYVEEVEEVDPKDDAAAAADDDDQGSSGGSASFLPRVSLSVSFLLVAALELYGCFVDTR
eukprot:jgi/Psemu1/289177/fgenesh1_pg.331_\